MLASRDAATNLSAVGRNDQSSFDQQRSYGEHHRQHELDELETSKGRRCLIKTTKFLFSHIGLVGLVVVYAVAGAFLFQLLELRQDKLACQEAQGEQNAQITALKQQLIAYVQNNVTAPTANNTNGKDNTTVAFVKIGSMLYGYRDFINDITGKYRYFNDDCSLVNKWTFANSLLFAITIMTTIGYGHITPVTWEGQLCTICYATIGIPIFLLCVANISGVLGEMFRFIYTKVICGPCKLVKKRQAQANRARFEDENGVGPDHAQSNGYALEDSHRKDSIKKPVEPLKTEEHYDEGDRQKYEQAAVPLTVTMLIIAAYIWIGSALFHSFEGWTMTEAGYFCFITLSTIGFGDLVPGQQKNDPNAGPKMILGAIYVLFGMAILAMCFDLMQEEIVAKFRWIGTKIGIIDKRDETLEEEEEQQQQANHNPTNQSSPIRNNRLSSSVTDPNASMPTRRTVLENEFENEHEIPRQRTSSGARKASPRTNTARVHPIHMNSANEANLYQRMAPSKPN